MGYTHYCRREQTDHDIETWKKFVNDCKTLYRHMPKHSHSSGDYYGDDPLYLSGCFAYRHPQFTQDKVHFNGGNVPLQMRIKKRDEHGRIVWCEEGMWEEGLEHETFQLYRKAWKKRQWESSTSALFSCCKTARKPYDLMVQACLILYKYYFPTVEVSSDGDVSDWTEAFKFVAEVLPHGSVIGTILLLDPAKGIFEEVYAMTLV